jgi:hypothetical protein
MFENIDVVCKCNSFYLLHVVVIMASIIDSSSHCIHVPPLVTMDSYQGVSKYKIMSVKRFLYLETETQQPRENKQARLTLGLPST